MTENKQQRPTLIATRIGLFSCAEVFRAPEMNRSKKARFRRASRAQNLREPHQKSRLKPQLMHRVIHTIHKAPVDITVDKETSTSSEKPQQNQHFKYHRLVRYSYRAVNTPLTAKVRAILAPRPRPAPIVTPIWNMHRSGAACSLNVTSIGICLSRQQHVFTAIAHFSSRNAPPPLTRPECGTIVKPTFGMLAAHEPRVFPGTS
jgi:hypothetical protein